MAELTRANLLPTIWVPPPEIRAWRQLVRARATLVADPGEESDSRVLGGGELPSADDRSLGWGGRAWLGAVALPPEVRREIQVQLALITALDEQLRGYDGEVKRLAAHEPAARLLQSIPGVGPFGAIPRVDPGTPRPSAGLNENECPERRLEPRHD